MSKESDPEQPKNSPPSDHNANAAAANNTSNHAVESVLSKWNKVNLLEKSALVLRSICCLFSLISFIVMASNKHRNWENFDQYQDQYQDDWENFDHYQEYKYCLAMEIVAFIYCICQVGYQVYRFSAGNDFKPNPVIGILNFAGDQVIAYLLISALSAAIPITNRMREGADNIFTDSTSASISMGFFAFLAAAVSAILSGYKLSTQTYI